MELGIIPRRPENGTSIANHGVENSLLYRGNSNEGSIMNRVRILHTALRFAIGLIVFILAMMITASDVLGLQAGGYRLPGSDGSVVLNSNGPAPSFDGMESTSGDSQSPQGSAFVQPPGVPEPSSLLLLGLGAGAILVRRIQRRAE
jgi:hypothetical protein